MKKIIIGLVVSIAFLLAAVYLFVPGKMKIEETISVNAALPAVSRMLTNYNDWNKWWPEKTVFAYRGEQYKPGRHTYDVIDIDIYSGTHTLKSYIELVIINEDSTRIMWNTTKFTNSNPFKRFSVYRDAGNTKKNIATLLKHISSFVENPENVYGLSVRKTKVVDSVLLTTRRRFDHKPDAKEIDVMIQNLKKYIAENNSVEKNYPMLNVTRIDSAHYDVMTAIPLDKALPNTNEFLTKYMLKGGNILEAQIQGGPHTVETAIKEFENYRSDYQYRSPAIPYQVLITDRAKETDTSKWITKLYYPIL
jgi:effector-binding domain-containing protein